MPLFCAKAAADPAPLEGDLAGGACARSHTVAVADYVVRGAGTCDWVQRGRRHVAVRASEAAGVSIDAHWYAVIRVYAVRGRTTQYLKENTIRYLYGHCVTFCPYEVRQNVGRDLFSGNRDSQQSDYICLQEQGERR